MHGGRLALWWPVLHMGKALYPGEGNYPKNFKYNPGPEGYYNLFLWPLIDDTISTEWYKKRIYNTNLIINKLIEHRPAGLQALLTVLPTISTHRIHRSFACAPYLHVVYFASCLQTAMANKKSTQPSYRSLWMSYISSNENTLVRYSKCGLI